MQTINSLSNVCQEAKLMTSFDFDTKPGEVSWVIEGLLPASQLVIMLAQAGVGKSLLAEYLAVCVVCGADFCGFKTRESDVLLIDQDTSPDRLAVRLVKFKQGIHTNKKKELFVESMQNHFLKKDMIQLILSHPTAKLVIIDSLISVCGNCRVNSNEDMSILAAIKQACLIDDRTILINHHISEKKELPVVYLMQEDPHQFSMAASAIIQLADSYYIVGADAQNGTTEKIYLRPISKRVPIKEKTMILKISPVDNGERIDYLSAYAPDLTDQELDVISFFQVKGTSEQRHFATVKEVYDLMGHRHSEVDVRKALNELHKKGLLLLTRTSHNLFQFHLP